MNTDTLTCENCDKAADCMNLCEDMEAGLPSENDGDIMDYDNENHVMVRYETEDELDYIIQEQGLANPQSTLCDEGDISALESFGFTELQKKIVKMKYFDGLPIAHIAVKVKLHPSTIKDSLENVKRKVGNAFALWSIWNDLMDLDWEYEYERAMGRKWKYAGELEQIAEMHYKKLMSPPAIANKLGVATSTIRNNLKKIKKILANL